MPEIAAEQFRRSIDELDRVVRDLGRTRRSGVVISTLLTASLLGGGSIIAWTLHARNEDRIELCRAGNQRFARVISFIEMNTPPDRRGFINGLRAVAVIDCDQDDQVSDDLVPEPPIPEESNAG